MAVDPVRVVADPRKSIQSLRTWLVNEMDYLNRQVLDGILVAQSKWSGSNWINLFHDFRPFGVEPAG